MLNRDFISTVATRFVILACGILTSVLSARMLGPGGRGEYFFVVTLALTASQFANLGLSSSNTYFVAGDRNNFRGLLANSFWISIVLGIAAIGVLAAVNLHAIPSVRLLAPAFLLAPGTLFFTLGGVLLVGTGRVPAFNAFQLASTFFLLLLFGVVAITRPTPETFLWASAVSSVVLGAALLWDLCRKTAGGLSFDAALFRQGFRYSTKAYITLLLGFLVLRANVFLLQRMQPASELGFYSIAAQAGDVLLIMPNSLGMILFPELVQSHEFRWELTSRHARSMALLMGALCLLTAIFIAPAVRIAFGASFAPSARVVLWLLPGLVAASIATIYSQYLAALGFPKRVLAIWAIVLITLLGCGWLLIPRFAAAGAAMASSISYSVLLVLLLHAAHTYARLAKRTASAAREAIAAGGV
jgi:antigen flippase